MDKVKSMSSIIVIQLSRSIWYKNVCQLTFTILTWMVTSFDYFAGGGVSVFAGPTRVGTYFYHKGTWGLRANVSKMATYWQLLWYSWCHVVTMTIFNVVACLLVWRKSKKKKKIENWILKTILLPFQNIEPTCLSEFERNAVAYCSSPNLPSPSRSLEPAGEGKPSEEQLMKVYHVLSATVSIIVR